MKNTILVTACLIAAAGCAKPAAPMPGGEPVKASPSPAPVKSASSPTTTALVPLKSSDSSIASGQAAAGQRDPVMATVRGTKVEVRQSQVVSELIEAYGLNTLMNLVQLEMARQTAREQNLSLSVETIDQERKWTLEKMFAEADEKDYPQLFERYLGQQKITRAQFDMAIETNAYLRKIAEPSLKDVITEDSLKAMFAASYGEKVKVSHIALGNMQEVADAKARLAAGEAFAAVARAMSRNPETQRLGGELPEFTINAKGYPDAFKQVAFSLKPGEVSDPVQADGSYHIIKLERRIAPKAVQYDDVKASLKRDLHERLLEEAIKALRQQLAGRALDSLQIEDAVLRAQFDAQVKERDKLVRDREGVKNGIKNANRPATRSTTAPALDTTSSPR